MDLGLAGKAVVVTGAGSGIGRAVATMFANEGAAVCAADINRASAEETAARVSGTRGTCSPFQIDVTERDGWRSLLQDAQRRLGKVDILCNIAGPGARTGHLDTDDAEWRRQIDGHLTGVFLGCQTVLPSMIERRYGKIVNICSFTAHGVAANIPGYCAAFGGILAYTKDLARFAAPHNINVNCVSPGNIDTPMTRSGWLERPGELEKLAERMPIGRIGQPGDVAAWVVFLASDRARHAVGIEVNVSGGQLLV